MEATTVAGNLSGNSTDKSVKPLPQCNINAFFMKTILLRRRYSYEQQPAICKWNIRKLGEMFTLICPQSALDPVVEEWDTVYRSVQVTTKCL